MAMDVGRKPLRRVYAAMRSLHVFKNMDCSIELVQDYSVPLGQEGEGEGWHVDSS